MHKRGLNKIGFGLPPLVKKKLCTDVEKRKSDIFSLFGGMLSLVYLIEQLYVVQAKKKWERFCSVNNMFFREPFNSV